MKVLLIEPPISPFDVPTGIGGLAEPLALESIAARMCLHHEVNILDMRIEEKLDEYLDNCQPDVVAVGSVTANHHLAKRILQHVKMINPKILTIIGGHHVTFMPQDAREGFIDVIVIGEGDSSAAEAIDVWEKKGDLANVPGLVINRDSEQITTKKPELLNMDELLLPARHLVARYRQHYFQRQYRPIVSINSSRGCPYRCNFCSLWKMNQGKYRTRSAKLIVDEIMTLEDNFIDFIDDNSLENVHRANEIADLLMKNKIHKKLKMYARADTIAKHPELISKLASAGLTMILAGFEAIREDSLQNWNKQCTLENNNRAIRILQENNIDVAAYFLVDPQFGVEDFEALSRYVTDMQLSDPVFTILVPFPGTDLYEARKNDIYWNDYRIFDFFHTVFKTKLPLNDFYDQFALLYKNAYLNNRKPTAGEISVDAEKIKMFQEISRRIQALKTHHIKK